MMDMGLMVVLAVVLPVIILLWTGTAVVVKMFWDSWRGE